MDIVKTYELTAGFRSNEGMNKSNATQINRCIPTTYGNFVILVSLITFPVHFLMIKVIVFDLRLALPRHMIMFCLLISDGLQIFISFLRVILVQIFSSTKESEECSSTGKIMFFIVAMTLVASSLSILALSVERYVACIHSFSLYKIFKRERVMYGISLIWILCVICGALTVALAAENWNEMILDAHMSMKILSVVFVIPTSLLVSGIQLRLLVFSRTKLARVRPRTMFGCEAEMANLRKKQIKVAFVASIVVFAYISCMLPMGLLSLYELINGNISSGAIRGVTKVLALVNNFADPYIYGLGVVDTRKALLKNLRKMKKFFSMKL